MKLFKVALFVAAISIGVQAGPLVGQEECDCAGEIYIAFRFLVGNSERRASPRKNLHIF